MLHNQASEYVKGIRGLMVGRTSDFDKIARRVDEFVALIPGLTEDLRKNAPEGDRKISAAFTSLIREAITMLNGVKALWLKQDAEALLRVAGGVVFDRDMCNKLLPPFLTNLLSLSINMQTAKNKSMNALESQNSIEILNGTVKNLSAVKELIKDPKQFSYAAQILADMLVLESDETAQQLISDLLAGQNGDELINGLIHKYSSEFDRIMKEGAATRHSIMLVDDRPEILETVGGYLKDTYKVFPLTRGALALKALEKQKVHLFILDIDMPDMDGITLATKIRALTEHRKTPIIILTSNASREYVVAAMRAGANDFIVKPANKDTLAIKIADFLKTAAA